MAAILYDLDARCNTKISLTRKAKKSYTLAMISTPHRRRERRRRRSRRPRKLLKGIASNLVRHPHYPWLAFDPRGVAAVEASRDLQKKPGRSAPRTLAHVD
ncbi:MAG: hypothetical protein QNJ06_11770 [Kiloniellales bacterium]|nr:hypothetical protein [Kiloniellales bacterium]